MPSSDIPVSAIDTPLRVEGKYFCAGGEVCLIRAVAFGPFPAGFFPDEGRSQLRKIRERLRANAIRLYEIPSLEFLHACAASGLRVFVTIPWEQHCDFLTERGVLARADRLLLETIYRFRGHPALAGYFVADAIGSDLVRWMGASRILEQLERLIDLGRANDPGVLFSYANDPSTESLLPQNQDFAAFRLPLDPETDLEARLVHLQNLAGEKPLFLSEVGADAKRFGELGQAEMLERALLTATATGTAGTTLYSWSDPPRDEATARSGDFGVLRSDLSERPAIDVVREAWSLWNRPGDAVVLEGSPKVSVILSSRGMSDTLVASLDSFDALDYPDFELILVNSGKDFRVEEIASAYSDLRLVQPEGTGLASGRNAGAAAASGEILAFSDTQCLVEPDWLKWIVRIFQTTVSSGRDAPSCAGGPVFAAKPESARRARIAAAPGKPANRLLGDTEAAVLSASNLAVRKELFEELGGFHPFFPSGGDDWEFCHRVSGSGRRIGFHPAAFLRRHRESSYPGYFKGQIEQGRAEALLAALRRDSFPGEPGMVSGARLSDLALHCLWWLLVLGLGMGSMFFPLLGYPAALIAGISLSVAVGRAGRAEVDPEFDSTASRFTLVGLVLLQGILRSGARGLRGWRDLDWAENTRFFASEALQRVVSDWWKLGDEKVFLRRGETGREDLLVALRERFEGAESDPEGKADLVIRKGRFWNYAVVILTESLEGEGSRIRLRLLAKPQWTTKLIVLPLLVLIPPAVVLGTGPGGEFVVLAILYGIVWIAAKVFLRVKRPRFSRIARSVGLEPP